VEREERARAGAPTPPPSESASVEQFENRNVLKPVERPEDEADDADKNPDAASNGDKSAANGDAAKESGKPADGEKTEYAEMTNQRASGTFGPPPGVSAPTSGPGFVPPGGAMIPGPQSNGFAPPTRPPPPPYMNGAAQAQG